jgi:selenocysteine-specific elongation factor
MRDKILKTYLDAGLAIPSFKEVMEPFSARRSEALSLVYTMIKEGALVKVTEDLYFHRDVLSKLREDYRAYLLREGKATPAGMKELTNLSRKYIIPLMEYFDATKLTIRTGDQRILRE